MKKFTGFILFMLLLSSCAFHHGMMTSNPNYNSPDYELSSMALGTSETVKFLGIGGLEKDALVLEAKKNMYAGFPLEKGQSYANLTVDFKNSYFIIFSKTLVTISADIVRPTEAGEPGEKYQPEFNQIRKYQQMSSGDIELGDTVLTYANHKVHDNRVIKILSAGDYLITPLKDTLTEVKRVKRSKLYITKNPAGESSSLKINSEVHIQGIGPDTGKIAGMGVDDVIIRVRKDDETFLIKRSYDAIMLMNK